MIKYGQMGRELSFAEMKDILDRNVPGTTDKNRLYDLKELSQFLNKEYIQPREFSHTLALADNLGARKKIEENSRQMFWELTGIDSRNCELPAEKWGFEVEKLPAVFVD